MTNITEFKTYLICDEFKEVSEIKILSITTTSYKFKKINENNQEIIFIPKYEFFKKYEILEEVIVIKPTVFLELNKTYLICDEFKDVSEIKILNITDTCYKIIKNPIVSSFMDFDFNEYWILKTEFFKKYEILEEIKTTPKQICNIEGNLELLRSIGTKDV